MRASALQDPKQGHFQKAPKFYFMKTAIVACPPSKMSGSAAKSYDSTDPCRVNFKLCARACFYSPYLYGTYNKHSTTKALPIFHFYTRASKFVKILVVVVFSSYGGICTMLLSRVTLRHLGKGCIICGNTSLSGLKGSFTQAGTGCTKLEELILIGSNVADCQAPT